MIQILNARKKEILYQQERMLNAASEAKVQLTAVENETFENLTKELDATNSNIVRHEAIAKGRAEVVSPPTASSFPIPASPAAIATAPPSTLMPSGRVWQLATSPTLL